MRQRGEQGDHGEQGEQGERGRQGEQGERGPRGNPGFDGDCCAGLVRLTERCENNEKSIDIEIEDRKEGNKELWVEINSTKGEISKMKTMVISGMASAMFAILLFIGSMVAHLLKVGP